LSLKLDYEGDTKTMTFSGNEESYNILCRYSCKSVAELIQHVANWLNPTYMNLHREFLQSVYFGGLITLPLQVYMLFFIFDLSLC